MTNKFNWILCVILAGTTFAASCQNNKSMEENQHVSKDMPLDTATFGAGCFWCVEAVFLQMKGVVHVESGYAGGHLKNPSYKEVCSGTTGHAEVAQVVYNPDTISYETFLEIFWHAHNPTTLNRQGGDVGTQYRSAIFYHTDAQKEAAEKSLEDAEKRQIWPGKIVTEITPINNYYVAENYHQNYLENNPNQAYCSAVVAPKVQKIRKTFKHLLKE